jgi:hypothetical protein
MGSPREGYPSGQASDDDSSDNNFNGYHAGLDYRPGGIAPTSVVIGEVAYPLV